MERILKQRDRLLGIAARLIGLVCATTSLVLLVLGDGRPGMVLVAAPCYVLLALAMTRMAATKALVWPVSVLVLGLVTAIVVRLGAVGALDAVIGAHVAPALGTGSVDAIRLLTAGAIASIGVVLTMSLGRMILLVGAFAGHEGRAHRLDLLGDLGDLVGLDGNHHDRGDHASTLAPSRDGPGRPGALTRRPGPSREGAKVLA